MESGQFLLLSVLCMLFILVVLAVSATFFCVRQRSHLRMKEKLASLGTDTSTDATATYQVRPAPPPLSQSGGRDGSPGPDWTKINSFKRLIEIMIQKVRLMIKTKSFCLWEFLLLFFFFKSSQGQNHLFVLLCLF